MNNLPRCDKSVGGLTACVREEGHKGKCNDRLRLAAPGEPWFARPEMARTLASFERSLSPDGADHSAWYPSPPAAIEYTEDWIGMEPSWPAIARAQLMLSAIVERQGHLHGKPLHFAY